MAPLVGRNLVALPLDAVTARIARHPWIAGLTVEKELPDGLRIEVTERRPVALLALPAKDRTAGEALVYADMAGRPIAPVAPGDDTARLLVVRLADHLAGGRPGDRAAVRPARRSANAAGRAGLEAALAVAGELGRANPTWAAGLTRVEVLCEEDFRLETRALPFPLLVRKGHVIAKARRLEALLPELGRRYARLERVDLRFSRRIVVQPAAEPPAKPPASSSPSGPAAEL